MGRVRMSPFVGKVREAGWGWGPLDQSAAVFDEIGEQVERFRSEGNDLAVTLK